MRKILKNLICFGLVLILSTSIIFANPDENSGSGMNATPPIENDMPIEDEDSTENDIVIEIEEELLE